MKKLLAMNYGMVAVIGAVLAGGIYVWLGWYSLSPEAADLAAQLVIAHSIAMILWPPAFLFTYFFRAIGRARFTMVVAIATMVVCRLGLAYLFVAALHLGVLWVWMAMFVDWAVRFIIYVIAFKRAD